jgi:cytochrome c-type biogenesis protein CcmH
LPPWISLLWVLLLLGALAAWVIRRGLSRQATEVACARSGDGEQAQANKRIQQQHLADLDMALNAGRLSTMQHASARDELMRQVLADQLTQGSSVQRVGGGVRAPVRWAWIVLLLSVLSGLSYWHLGAPQTWSPVPLSQQVQISATPPEQLAEQTRAWQEATQNKPEDAQAWLTLARLQAAQNAYGPAEQALARVLVLSPEPDLWIERAQMKALSAGGVYAGEPWQWIQNVLREQPLHLNALVLAGSAALSEQKPVAAQNYWQKALTLVPADSEAAQALRQALEKAAAMLAAVREVSQSAATTEPLSAGNSRPIVQGEVRVSPELKNQIAVGATLFCVCHGRRGIAPPGGHLACNTHRLAGAVCPER